MWCAVTATVHFSAAVVFFQSASVNFPRRVVASSTFASNCVANASPLAPMNVTPFLFGMQPAPPDSPPLIRRTRQAEIDVGRYRPSPVRESTTLAFVTE